MSRQLYRVPLDFDWPLNKVWQGFINPHYKPCPKEAVGECSGGTNGDGRWLDAIARFIALVGEEAAAAPYAEQLRMRRRIYPHPYLTHFTQAPRVGRGDRIAPLGADMVRLVEGLTGQKVEPLKLIPIPGHKIGLALLKAAGLEADETWGICATCGGKGVDPAALAAYEAWKASPPPSGEGWQLWETVSEGSPISPVFKSREELVRHLVGKGYSPKAAEAFCESGWAPTGGGANGTFKRDIESLVGDDDQETTAS